MSAKPVIVRITGVSKRYGSQPVLRDLSLDVRTSEVLAVVGPSGGGKSTLLRCLSGLENLDAGEITVGGRGIGQLRRGEVGMVFQQLHLFPHLTALDNIALAPRLAAKRSKHDARERARELLATVGLADKEEAYPHQLSGGQQQRVAIARSLAMEPSVMLFDEVTSALDRELVLEVLKVMRQLAESGMTMVAVTHELWFAENVADRVVFLADGEVVEEGPPSAFFRSPTTDRAQRFLREILPEKVHDA